jgi:hypothetical protein
VIAARNGLLLQAYKAIDGSKASTGDKALALKPVF